MYEFKNILGLNGGVFILNFKVKILFDMLKYCGEYRVLGVMTGNGNLMINWRTRVQQ